MDDHASCAGHSHGNYDQTLDEIKFENSIFNACVVGDLQKVKNKVKQHGQAILNEQDKNGYSCLHYAARNSHYEICKYLIENGINVNLKTASCGSTALHRAAFIGNSKIVQILLENKANALEKDCDGKTALHKCVDQYFKAKTNDPKQHEETMSVLLKFNSNLKDICDNKSMTPLDYFPDLKYFL